LLVQIFFACFAAKRDIFPHAEVPRKERILLSAK
jgi:hypothetical protein